MKLSLTKQCSSCGLEKPLAAFLQILGAKNTYGNICATCRKSDKKGGKITTDESSDESGTGSGLRLDDKAKVKREIDEKKHREHIKELDLEEHERDTKALDEKLEKSEIISKREREHRETFLDTRSVLTTHKIDPQQAAEARQKMQRVAEQALDSEKINILKQASREEQQIKGINTIDPDQSTYFGILEKHKGVTFKAFVSWLTAAPMKATHEKSTEQVKGTHQKPNEKATLSDIIHEWKRPGSKK